MRGVRPTFEFLFIAYPAWRPVMLSKGFLTDQQKFAPLGALGARFAQVSGQPLAAKTAGALFHLTPPLSPRRGRNIRPCLVIGPVWLSCDPRDERERNGDCNRKVRIFLRPALSLSLGRGPGEGNETNSNPGTRRFQASHHPKTAACGETWAGLWLISAGNIACQINSQTQRESKTSRLGSPN